MTPHIADLVLRCRENLDKGVNFEVGMDTFLELIQETLTEMERKCERLKV